MNDTLKPSDIVDQVFNYVSSGAFYILPRVLIACGVIGIVVGALLYFVRWRMRKSNVADYRDLSLARMLENDLAVINKIWPQALMLLAFTALAFFLLHAMQ
jgi:hypothetical protein